VCGGVRCGQPTAGTGCRECDCRRGTAKTHDLKEQLPFGVVSISQG